MLDKDAKKRLILFEIFLEDLKQGVMICDAQGKIILYNRAYSELDKMLPEQVIGKHVEKSYEMTKQTSVLYTVMRTKKTVLANRQQYKTIFGYHVDLIHDTYPLIYNDEVLGAFSIVRDFNQTRFWAENLIRDILDNANQKHYDIIIDFMRVGVKNKKMQKNISIIKKVISSFQNLSICGGGDNVVKAFGAIDMALWDIKGKYFNLPLYKLLGGAYKKEIPFTEYFAFQGDLQKDGSYNH